jgi:N-glycosylase/DNA lyase
LKEILSSDVDKYQKRNLIKNEFCGIGMKEASHFLRNIGYKNLAIIDRHILRNLEFCGVLENTIAPKNEKTYMKIEELFYNYSIEIGIEMDVLDLLFFANSTGMVLK